MSFYCNAKKQVVIGEKLVQVPTLIRKVKYIGINSGKNFRTGEEYSSVTGEFDGWEVAEYISVCQEMAEQYKLENSPRVCQTVKQVKFFRKNPRNETQADYSSYDDDYRGERER